MQPPVQPIQVSGPLIAVFSFGVIFVAALLLLAIKFPRPTPFQYTVFRIVLALAAAGIAAFIPGLLNVTVGSAVTAGGALGVFVVVYFFSPAALATAKPGTSVTQLLDGFWSGSGVRAPDPTKLDPDQAHRALNALQKTARLWSESNQDERKVIREECWESAYRPWFFTLDGSDFVFSDGKSAREHLDGLIRDTYKEMNTYVS